MRRWMVFAWLLVVGSLAGGQPVAGQEVSEARLNARPQFFFAGRAGLVPLDVAKMPVLAQRLALDLEGVTLKQALGEIAARSGLRLVYTDDMLPSGQAVHLRAQAITVAAALTDLLLGSGVDVVFQANGGAALVRRGAARATGTIVGQVKDAKTGDAIVGAEVFVEGGKVRTVSGDKGYYRLPDVEAGTYTLAARRVGFAKQNRPVVVAAGQEVTVDFALPPVVTQLNELVTTVTGEQRRIELGHVVGVINADSVIKEAPVSSLSELLSGRVAGLQVFQSQGTVGGSVQLQSRGPNSILLNVEPIVVIDGVRYSSQRMRGLDDYPWGQLSGETSSPLNELNSNDIESVEIVKGPSAATLYGTDASNGVVVITTKRGRPGPVQWRAYGRSSRTEIPTSAIADTWWGWSAEGSNVPYPFSCSLQRQSTGSCVLDSVSNIGGALKDAEQSVLGHAPFWQAGLSATGGRQDIRYFFSGDFDNQIGAVRTPDAAIDEYIAAHGKNDVVEQLRNPNKLTNVNLRANLTAMLGDRLEARVNSGYIHSLTRGLQGGPYFSAFYYAAPGLPYGRPYLTPAEAFAQTSDEKTDRSILSASGQWRPRSWFLGKATIGTDIANRDKIMLVRRGDTPNWLPNGRVEDERVHQIATTADLSATITARRGRLGFRTSFGGQFTRSAASVLHGRGSNLPPGGTSISQAVTVTSGQGFDETATLGSYFEQQIGLNDRLFLIGALRADGASTFGQNYKAAVYPKVSLSWLLSDEPFMPRIRGLEELRLRYAFGASGQQPLPEWARPTFQSTQVYVDAVTTGMQISSYGNPDLRPERVREHEAGLDATAFSGKLQVGLTWYQRNTIDQIANFPLPPGMGSIATNLGLTRQHGFEAELIGRVLDSRQLSVDIVYHYALHRTKLVDLGGSSEYKTDLGGYVEGYPLGARFEHKLLGYNDANSDGIITPNEVIMTDQAIYAGESTPPITHTLTPTLGFFDRHVRVSALFERRTGYVQVNAVYRSTCQAGLCRAAVDPSTSLDEQAVIASYSTSNTEYGMESAAFTRFRELSVSADVPRSWSRALRVSNATVALAARNVALWSKYNGPDPESSSVNGISGGSSAGIPQARTWTLRVDLAF